MMTDKDKSKRNVRDATSAWEVFRSFIHRGLPGSAQQMDQLTRVAGVRRNY